MVDKNKVLDEVIRREKVAKIKKYGTLVLLALVFGGIFSYSQFKNYDRVKFSKELSGVIKEIIPSASKEGVKEVFSIELENGKMIQVPKRDFAKLNLGESVKILRQELESGQLRYSIVFSEF